MTFAEFLIDIGGLFIAFGLVALFYAVVLWLLFNFMGGTK